MQDVHGEPSHHLATPELDLNLTARGGHLAPVVFHLPDRDVSPYALAPWQPEEYPDHPALLSVLRGDFFCLPFGGQENGPPHGDPANAPWQLTGETERSLTLHQKAFDSGGTIQKTISIKSLKNIEVDKVAVMTTGEFTKNAQQMANENKVEIFDGNKIREL